MTFVYLREERGGNEQTVQHGGGEQTVQCEHFQQEDCRLKDCRRRNNLGQVSFYTTRLKLTLSCLTFINSKFTYDLIIKPWYIKKCLLKTNIDFNNEDIIVNKIVHQIREICVIIIFCSLYPAQCPSRFKCLQISA